MFIHGVRNKIRFTRQYLSYGTHYRSNMFNTVDYHIVVVRKNNIAVFTHQFNYKMLDFYVAKFIKMLNFKINDSLKSRLCYTDNSSIINMFFLSNIQKLGAVIGLGLLLFVKYIKGRLALALRSILY